ncbi:hypothetical protein FE257_009905 [Aspergillus nanangensis]|uniref:Uncharacterized protein n=1 Tax=Aspergillus nanangensis TaxID=2582783 RepID=A0AAD4CW07_ASPNN|nr:hypothetical protein FE257_009905 [Aspergillus nanangensis]
MENPTSPDPDPPRDRDEYKPSSKGKFRFKSPSRTKSSHDRHKHRHGHDDSKRRHHHHHHHRSKRHKSKHEDTRSASPNPAPTSQAHLNTDDAFRESLFDALGDDEGASYWESIYGQPIHTYAVPNVPTGPNGELEQMSDEEYAAYVRARMWERTREGMQEEQERQRMERMRQRRQAQMRDEDGRERARFERDMEECLRRGKERRRVKAWRTVWEEYLRAWEGVDRAAKEAAVISTEGKLGNKEEEEEEKQGNRLRNLLFWPVETGKRRDVSREAVEEFMRHAPGGDDDDGRLGMLAVLKAERIRWHPDKIQHRYGVLGIDDVVIRSVTEVFQIVDRMWGEVREKQS